MLVLLTNHLVFVQHNINFIYFFTAGGAAAGAGGGKGVKMESGSTQPATPANAAQTPAAKASVSKGRRPAGAKKASSSSSKLAPIESDDESKVIPMTYD